MRGLPDDGTCDVPKHAGDLLTSSEHILCMESWLYKLIVFIVHGTYSIKREAACCSLGWVSTYKAHFVNPEHCSVNLAMQGHLNYNS